MRRADPVLRSVVSTVNEPDGRLWLSHRGQKRGHKCSVSTLFHPRRCDPAGCRLRLPPALHRHFAPSRPAPGREKCRQRLPLRCQSGVIWSICSAMILPPPARHGLPPSSSPNGENQRNSAQWSANESGKAASDESTGETAENTGFPGGNNERPRSDSNRRITDLQSVPLVHLGTRP